LWNDHIKHGANDDGKGKFADVLPMLDEATQAAISISLIKCLDKGKEAGMFLKIISNILVRISHYIVSLPLCYFLKEIRSTLMKARRTKSSADKGNAVFLHCGPVLQLPESTLTLCARLSDICKEKK